MYSTFIFGAINVSSVDFVLFPRLFAGPIYDSEKTTFFVGGKRLSHSFHGVEVRVNEFSDVSFACDLILIFHEIKGE